MRSGRFMLYCTGMVLGMIRIENISVRYPDGRVAVRELSLKIAAGERVALLGANGAGKSSLLLALVGMAPLQSGRLCIAGAELGPKTLRAIRHRCGLLFQNPDDQLFAIRVWDDIAFGPQNLGWSKEETAAKTGTIMERLGIAHLAEYPPHKLSGGEKRKVALAGILVMEPEIVLFDEPTAFLDPRSQRELAKILSGLPQTCLVATHDLSFARAVCGRAVVLNAGGLVCAGEINDVLGDDAMLVRCGLL